MPENIIFDTFYIMEILQIFNNNKKSVNIKPSTSRVQKIRVFFINKFPTIGDNFHSKKHYSNLINDTKILNKTPTAQKHRWSYHDCITSPNLKHTSSSLTNRLTHHRNRPCRRQTSFFFCNMFGFRVARYVDDWLTTSCDCEGFTLLTKDSPWRASEEGIVDFL